MTHSGKSLISNIQYDFVAIVTLAGMSFGLWKALAWVTAPICFLKQTVSVIQLYAACYNVALIDEADRAKVTN